MPIIDITAAQAQLPSLLEAVTAGEEVILSINGKPVARLVAVPVAPLARMPGGMEGQIWVADDFDSPLPQDLQRAFEGQ